jgi:hypothetical protein
MGTKRENAAITSSSGSFFARLSRRSAEMPCARPRTTISQFPQGVFFFFFFFSVLLLLSCCSLLLLRLIVVVLFSFFMPLFST